MGLGFSVFRGFRLIGFRVTASRGGGGGLELTGPREGVREAFWAKGWVEYK